MRISIQKAVTFSIVVLLASIEAIAQTFVWSMPLREYTNITRISRGLYQFESEGKKGLIKPDGTVVVDAILTEITPFYENLALLISKEGGRDRVVGTINTTGKCNLFKQDYYTLAGQAFYSDGLLSVENENGIKGYIDENGNEWIGFQNHYTTIKPFTEGYAAVFKNKEYALIDKSGTKQSMIIGIGKVLGGTNVYNSNAVIWDEEGNFYTFNTNTKKCNATRKPQNIQIDYLYCLSEISKRSKEVPYSQIPRGVIGISSNSVNGMYGFDFADKTVLPAQFESATPIEDGFSVVSKDGKFGILSYVENSEDFIISTPKSEIGYYSGKEAECTFTLASPEIYKALNVNVVAKDETNIYSLNYNKRKNEYSFMSNPKGSKQSYVVDVIYNDLILKTDTITYKFKKKSQGLQISIGVSNNAIADADGKVWVTATIRNPNGEEVQTIVNMTGGSAKFKEMSKTIVVKANSVVQISSCFYDVKAETANQQVTVSLSNGVSKTSGKITLKPYKHDPVQHDPIPII